MKTLLISLTILSAFVWSSFAPATTSGYSINDEARDFKLKNVDGNFVSLADYKDAKGIIVVFTCNHCPFSVAYEDRIIALHKTYAAKGFPVVAINPNDPISYPSDSYENMQIRAKEKKFPFAYLIDETQDIAKTYGALKTPHVFILRKSGSKYIVSYIGAIDDNSDDEDAVKTKYAENALNDILAGREIGQATTKAIGCGVKWKK
ncbi:MAG: thioredoxin family protein [Chitinophagaceae bacterium]